LRKEKRYLKITLDEETLVLQCKSRTELFCGRMYPKKKKEKMILS